MRFCSSATHLPYFCDFPYKITGNNLKFTSVQLNLGVKIDRALKFHGNVSKIVGTVGLVLTKLLSNTLCRSRDFMLNLHISHIRPKIEYVR